MKTRKRWERAFIFPHSQRKNRDESCPFLAVPNEILFAIFGHLDQTDIQGCRLVCRRFNEFYKNNEHRLPFTRFSLKLCLHSNCLQIDGFGKLFINHYGFKMFCTNTEASLVFREPCLVKYEKFSEFFRKRGKFFEIREKYKFPLACEFMVKTKSLEESLEIHLEFLSQFAAQIDIELWPGTQNQEYQNDFDQIIQNRYEKGKSLEHCSNQAELVTLSYEKFCSMLLSITTRRKLRLARLLLSPFSELDPIKCATFIRAFNEKGCREFDVSCCCENVESTITQLCSTDEEIRHPVLQTIFQLSSQRLLRISKISCSTRYETSMKITISTSDSSKRRVHLRLRNEREVSTSLLLKFLETCQRKFQIKTLSLFSNFSYDWIWRASLTEISIKNEEITQSFGDIQTIINFWKEARIEIGQIQLNIDLSEFSVEDLDLLGASIDFVDQDSSTRIVATLKRNESSSEKLKILIYNTWSPKAHMLLVSNRCSTSYLMVANASRLRNWYWDFDWLTNRLWEFA